MNWQPPPPPPRPGGQGPVPGGPGGQRPPYGQGPGGGGGGGGGQPPQQPQQQQGPAEKDWKELNYYQLLQVNREAHSTIIRYAYRFLAAMYHPDNTETGDAEKFRIITEAWRTLSDDGKRAAYDMSLGADEELQPRHPGAGGGGPRPAGAGFKRENMPKIKTGVAFNEIELRLAILTILLEERRKKPKSGGASAKMIMDVLDIRDISEIEFALWYMREKGFLEMGERSFMITAKGVDYVVDSLSKTTVLQESETEKKMRKVVDGGVPAVIPH